MAASGVSYLGFLKGYTTRFMSRFYGFLAILFAVLVLAACSSQAEVQAPPAPSVAPTDTRPISTRAPTATAVTFERRPTFTPLPTASPIPTNQAPGFGYGPDDFPPDINPLTGLRVSDPSLLERRPMVIKITNFPRSVRPQWGLTVADHIYEYYLEDGMTRFVGIFYSQDAERVGPVRSARPFDEHLLRMYKAILAFAYADDRVIDPWIGTDISKFLVIQRSDNCPPLCRIGEDDDYNNLYANTAQLSQYISERGVENGRQNLNGLRFETGGVYNGDLANKVAIRYSSTSHHQWEYDPVTQRYQRSQEAQSSAEGEEVYEPLFDSLTAERVAADNLVILMAEIDYFYQSNSTDIYDIYLLGKGKAYALRDGQIFELTWERWTMEEMLALKYPSGKNYPLKPGNVWFEVLGQSSSVTLEAGPTWHFNYAIP
jgi:hypothetical protein